MVQDTADNIFQCERLTSTLGFLFLYENGRLRCLISFSTRYLEDHEPGLTIQASTCHWLWRRVVTRDHRSSHVRQKHEGSTYYKIQVYKHNNKPCHFVLFLCCTSTLHSHPPAPSETKPPEALSKVVQDVAGKSDDLLICGVTTVLQNIENCLHKTCSMFLLMCELVLLLVNILQQLE